MDAPQRLPQIRLLLLNLWAIRAFRRSNTPLHVRFPVRCIVTTGPYRFSRNPV